MGLKQELNAKKLSIGSWITIGHPTVAEIMAKAGFDWLAIDLEHSPISIDQCQELIRVIDLCNVPSFVRVGANDPLLIKQAMDSGAHGVIVPMVNTKEDAQKAVAAVKYPPEGSRGVGLSRAQEYGVAFDKYKQWNKEESIVVVQIEHVKAVENLEEILSVEGVDAFIVGPYDLSGSLGIPGNFNDEQMLLLMEKIRNSAQKIGLPYGYHIVSSNSKLVQEKIDQGCQFMAYGVDFLFLGDHCRAGLEVLRKENRG